MALLTHTAAQGNGTVKITTSGLTTTGATLIVLVGGAINGSNPLQFSDNQGNTYTALNFNTGSASREMQMAYKDGPTTAGANGHTFSLDETGTGTGFPGLAVLVFDNTPSSPFDTQSAGNVSATTTVAGGSVTPSQANNLLVTGGYGDGTAAITVDSGFTKTDALPTVGGSFEGIWAAYLIQTSATAQNPTWTVASNAAAILAMHAAFKENGGGGGGGGSNWGPWILGPNWNRLVQGV